MELLNNGYFWQKIDSLVLSTHVVISQEQGTHHPKYLEVKLLLGCTPEEELEILRFINQTDYQKGILVRRGTELPDWAMTD